MSQLFGRYDGNRDSALDEGHVLGQEDPNRTFGLRLEGDREIMHGAGSGFARRPGVGPGVQKEAAERLSKAVRPFASPSPQMRLTRTMSRWAAMAGSKNETARGQARGGEWLLEAVRPPRRAASCVPPPESPGRSACGFMMDRHGRRFLSVISPEGGPRDDHAKACAWKEVDAAEGEAESGALPPDVVGEFDPWRRFAPIPRTDTTSGPVGLGSDSVLRSHAG